MLSINQVTLEEFKALENTIPSKIRLMTKKRGMAMGEVVIVSTTGDLTGIVTEEMGSDLVSGSQIAEELEE